MSFIPAHFVLDFDVEQLDSAQFRFAQVAGDIDLMGRDIVAVPEGITPSEWSGKARDMACAEMRAVGLQVQSYQRYFARISVAVKTTAAAVRAEQVQVNLLNKQWNNVVEDRAAAARRG